MAEWAARKGDPDAWKEWWLNKDARGWIIVCLLLLAAIAVLLRPFVRPQGPSTIDLAVVSFFAVVGLGTWPLSGHADWRGRRRCSWSSPLLW